MCLTQTPLNKDFRMIILVLFVPNLHNWAGKAFPSIQYTLVFHGYVIHRSVFPTPSQGTKICLLFVYSTDDKVNARNIQNSTIIYRRLYTLS
jgi:hypothetical protein